MTHICGASGRWLKGHFPCILGVVSPIYMLGVIFKTPFVSIGTSEFLDSMYSAMRIVYTVTFYALLANNTWYRMSIGYHKLLLIKICSLLLQRRYMGTTPSQITDNWTKFSRFNNKWIHQISALMASVWGIHDWEDVMSRAIVSSCRKCNRAQYQRNFVLLALRQSRYSNEWHISYSECFRTFQSI